MKKQPTFQTIKYGELVEYHPGNDGYHAGVKVHFFNKKGVFIGNYYMWVPYSQLRFRIYRHRERVYYGKRFQELRQIGYELLCDVVTVLIRITQKMCA